LDLSQFRVYSGFENFKGLSANQEIAIDKKDGLASNAGLKPNLILGLNQIIMALFIHTGIKFDRIQAGLGGKLLGYGLNIAAPQSVLIFKEDIVKFPEAALVGGALGGLVGLVRVVEVVENRGEDDGDLACFHVAFSNSRFCA
jgi:hypothetical protein